jgi:hypothetical protein
MTHPDIGNLTETQRERIVRDVINHKSESRAISKETYREEDIERDREQFSTMSDDELVTFWSGQVGEWICSIGGEYPSFIEAWEDVRGEYEHPAEWQLDVLLDHGDVNYGYQFPVYEMPYN